MKRFMRGGNMKRPRFGFRDRSAALAVTFLAVVAMVFLASACSTITPACDGEKTVQAVIEAAVVNMKKDLAGMTGVLGRHGNVRGGVEAHAGKHGCERGQH
jgi:hypothetical protein